MKEQVTINKDTLKIWQENNLEPLRYDYDVSPGDYILDIGSYQREWGKEFEKKGCKVEYFDALDNRAAWIYDGTIKTGGAYYYTSMFAEETPNEYKCVDIAPFLKSEVRLVKINIEGGEYTLLNYILDHDLMKNIIDLQVQFHLIDGVDTNTVYHELSLRLSKTHEVTWCYPFVWESWRKKL